MLKCKIIKDKTIKVHTKGTGQQMTVETLALIKMIYQGIKKENAGAAELYRKALIGTLLDPNSPVWKGEQG